jgi:hypothetical protein
MPAADPAISWLRPIAVGRTTSTVSARTPEPPSPDVARTELAATTNVSATSETLIEFVGETNVALNCELSATASVAGNLSTVAGTFTDGSAPDVPSTVLDGTSSLPLPLCVVASNVSDPSACGLGEKLTLVLNFAVASPTVSFKTTVFCSSLSRGSPEANISLVPAKSPVARAVAVPVKPAVAP